MCCPICKKSQDFFKNHVVYNAITHLVIGIGIGILVTYPLVGIHPLRWGLGFLVVGGLAHLYPLILKK